MGDFYAEENEHHLVIYDWATANPDHPFAKKMAKAGWDSRPSKDGEDTWGAFTKAIELGAVRYARDYRDLDTVHLEVRPKLMTEAQKRVIELSAIEHENRTVIDDYDTRKQTVMYEPPKDSDIGSCLRPIMVPAHIQSRCPAWQVQNIGHRNGRGQPSFWAWALLCGKREVADYYRSELVDKRNRLSPLKYDGQEFDDKNPRHYAASNLVRALPYGTKPSDLVAMDLEPFRKKEISRIEGEVAKLESGYQYGGLRPEMAHLNDLNFMKEVLSALKTKTKQNYLWKKVKAPSTKSN